jgi:hypothetical protein
MDAGLLAASLHRIEAENLGFRDRVTAHPPPHDTEPRRAGGGSCGPRAFKAWTLPLLDAEVDASR